MMPEDMRQKIEEMKKAADETLEEQSVASPEAAQTPVTTIVKQYGKYQYSVFLDSARNGQLVIRTDTFKELMEAKKNINLIIEKVEAKKATPPTPTEPDPALQVTCWSCGALAEERRGISKKNGKPWRAIMCSTGNSSHTKFL